MRLKDGLLLFLCMLFALKTHAQHTPLEYHIHLNTNLYLPQGDINQGTYPVLWYDEETDPKVLLGGIGLGFSALQALNEKLHWKAQANLSKHTYWDEPIMMKTDQGNFLGPLLSGSSDFVLGLTGVVHYHLWDKVSVGTGVGSQVLLASFVRHPNSFEKRKIAANKYYKRIMPVIPLELSIKLEKHLINIRYEHGLLNRFKSPLSDYKSGRYSMLYFEFGFKLQQ